ncbi:uncharacterized protein DS421_15g519140 [Arachis hypogaea]|nr:uncharacterized protein DS421_15g519140 [Arachis hypogaea]
MVMSGFHELILMVLDELEKGGLNQVSLKLRVSNSVAVEAYVAGDYFKLSHTQNIKRAEKKRKGPACILVRILSTMNPTSSLHHKPWWNFYYNPQITYTNTY